MRLALKNIALIISPFFDRLKLFYPSSAHNPRLNPKNPDPQNRSSVSFPILQPIYSEFRLLIGAISTDLQLQVVREIEPLPVGRKMRSVISIFLLNSDPMQICLPISDSGNFSKTHLVQRSISYQKADCAATCGMRSCRTSCSYER